VCTRGSFPGDNTAGREADHSPPCSAEVKYAWNYTSIPPIRLHGVVLSYSTGTTLPPPPCTYKWSPPTPSERFVMSIRFRKLVISSKIKLTLQKAFIRSIIDLCLSLLAVRDRYLAYETASPAKHEFPTPLVTSNAFTDPRIACGFQNAVNM
jgi:hypothetical protein